MGQIRCLNFVYLDKSLTYYYYFFILISDKYLTFFFFFIAEMIVEFIYIELLCTMGKRKEGYSSNQRITFSFSFVALAKVRTTLLHRKGKI